MKIYDIPVRGRRRVIPLVVENLSNKFFLILRNDILFDSGSLPAEVAHNILAVNHMMVLSSSDILVNTGKEISVLHEFTFDHEVNVQKEHTISLSEEVLKFNSSSEFTNTRYRLLGDMDTMTLAELDGYTLEELDYITVEQGDETDG